VHKFIRGEEPIDMTRVQRKYGTWDKFAGSDEHKQLGTALYERQSNYCAYCTRYLKEKRDGHIEHLERRSDNSKRTFDWTNMFFSCNDPGSCGKYKDTKKVRFDPKDIVDPSVEDPSDFFCFDAVGLIRARKGTGQLRAEETIRVFNLNAPKLVGARAAIVCAIEDLRYCSDEELDKCIAGMHGQSYLAVWCILLGRKIPQKSEAAGS